MADKKFDFNLCDQIKAYISADTNLDQEQRHQIKTAMAILVYDKPSYEQKYGTSYEIIQHQAASILNDFTKKNGHKFSEPNKGLVATLIGYFQTPKKYVPT